MNANRNAYEVYVSDGAGGEVLLMDDVIDEADFQQITKSVITFGDDGLKDIEAPYTPKINLNAGLTYDIHKLTIGVSGHYVSEQFTEFHNFTSESADGAIGKLPAFFTMDAFANYDFKVGRKLNMTAFINGKNLTNDVYRASRLNRATSGIFGGGFREVVVGISMKI